MTSRQRFISILIGIAGVIGSSLALVGFLLKIQRKGLVIPGGASGQALYESVGVAYSGGFVAGFSLCFFLTLLAVAVGTLIEKRDYTAEQSTKSIRNRLAGPNPRE
jgi:Na+/H+-translocating membrane pyrophosphatase